MATTNKTVYVLSAIPRLAKLVQEKLTNIIVVDVKHTGGVDGKFGTANFEDEINALKDAEVLIVDNNILAEISDKLPNVKWAQGTWAGVEMFLKNSKKIPAFPVSRMVSSTFSQLLAEYTIGWILINERGWLDARQYQLKNQWEGMGKIGSHRCLKELIVGVMGMGSIGKEVARCLKGFQSEVHAFTRTVPSPEHKSKDVGRYWYTGEMLEFLGNCDYIINIMPSTPETRGLLGRDTFKHAKKDAVFINIGRGDVISEADLIRALDAGWLSTAILDVFEEEPLPKESKLWRHPKVMLTPHVAGVSRAEDIVEAFLLNYNFFINGQQIKNIIDWKAGY